MTETNKKKHKGTEAAERRAEELGVNLAAVEGTGYDGQITVDDVERTSHAKPASAPSTGQGNPQGNPQNGSNNGDEKVAEAIENASTLLHTDLQNLEEAVTKTDAEVVLNGDEQNIINQDRLLEATLAGPNGRKSINRPWPALTGEDFIPGPPPARWDIPGPFVDYDY